MCHAAWESLSRGWQGRVPWAQLKPAVWLGMFLLRGPRSTPIRPSHLCGCEEVGIRPRRENGMGTHSVFLNSIVSNTATNIVTLAVSDLTIFALSPPTTLHFGPSLTRLWQAVLTRSQEHRKAL